MVEMIPFLFCIYIACKMQFCGTKFNKIFFSSINFVHTVKHKHTLHLVLDIRDTRHLN